MARIYSVKTYSQPRILLGFFLPYVLFISLSFLAYLLIDYFHYKNKLASNEVIQVELARISLLRDFEIVLPDISVLANDDYLQQYLNSSDSHSRQSLIEEFKTFLIHKRLYRMIRILDLSGMEQIRVEYRDGDIIVIPRQQLQDKSHRYYFQESIGFGLGELYISPIDLNVEFNKIELPHSPMIRFAINLYNNNNQKTAILVLNYLAQPMLDHFDQMLSGSSGHVALLNHEGYWIRSHHKENEWGFMHDSGHTFPTDHADVWEQVRRNESGQIHVTDGLFTYTTVYPIEFIGGYSENEVEDEHADHHHIDPKLYSWRIISHVPQPIIFNKITEHILGLFGVLWLALLIIGFFLSRHFCNNYILHKTLKQQNELHAKIYDTTTDGIFITDPDKNIITCNQAFTNITGYSEDEVKGLPLRILSTDINDYGFYKKLWSDLNKQGYWVGEITNKHKQGFIFNEWLRISTIYDDEGNIVNYVVIISDITKIKEREQRLQELASRDSLTGLYNRHAFYIKLENDIAYSDRYNSKLALLYIDLNEFKPINDRYGHNAGDTILIAVAKRILNNVRGLDTVARVGGDEFVVVLKNIESRSNAEKTKQILLQSIQEPIHHQSHQLIVGASIGIAIFPDEADNSNDLVSFADQAMYREKHKTEK